MKTTWITDDEMMKTERYLKVIKWARLRYTVRGLLTVSVGFNPAMYSRIEAAAWTKYMA